MQALNLRANQVTAAEEYEIRVRPVHGIFFSAPRVANYISERGVARLRVSLIFMAPISRPIC